MSPCSRFQRVERRRRRISLHCWADPGQAMTLRGGIDLVQALPTWLTLVRRTLPLTVKHYQLLYSVLLWHDTAVIGAAVSRAYACLAPRTRHLPPLPFYPTIALTCWWSGWFVLAVGCGGLGLYRLDALRHMPMAFHAYTIRALHLKRLRPTAKTKRVGVQMSAVLLQHCSYTRAYHLCWRLLRLTRSALTTPVLV